MPHAFSSIVRSLLIAPALLLAAQRFTFDTASIKPSLIAKTVPAVSPMKNGRFAARNITAKLLVAIAFQVDGFKISGGPDWLDGDRFDVEAKADVPPPDEDLPLLLQSLLADRFQLKVHRENRETPALALVVTPKGPRFLPIGHRDCTAGGDHVGCSGIRFAGRGLTAEYVSMPAFVRALTGIIGTPVLDESGLKGRYDFKLDFIDPALPGQTGLNVDGIFAALPQQLGLKLESKKASMETLVIDAIRKPSAN